MTCETNEAQVQGTNKQLQSWIAQASESVSMPLLQIIDAHFHFWDKPKYAVGSTLPQDVASMFGCRSSRGAPYLSDDFIGDIDGNNVTKTVYIENTGAFYDSDLPPHLQQIGEAQRCQEIFDSTRHNTPQLCAGFVGRADFMLGPKLVNEVLTALSTAAPSILRGIRQQTVHDPDPRVFSRCPAGLLAHPTFREGFQLLARYNLSADVVVYHTQLAEVADLARAFPHIPIALDHVGTPLGVGPYAGNTAEVFEVWKTGIHDVAQCPNVVVKLSGLTMPICGFGWERLTKPPDSATVAAALAPYVQHCIVEFGPKRCMFASNFPVDKASCSYTTLWNAFKLITQDLPPGDRERLFSGTAQRFYRL